MAAMIWFLCIVVRSWNRAERTADVRARSVPAGTSVSHMLENGGMVVRCSLVLMGTILQFVSWDRPTNYPHIVYEPDWLGRER
jgi:hypothetical protein